MPSYNVIDDFAIHRIKYEMELFTGVTPQWATPTGVGCPDTIG
ncbi:hypothetical protein GCM10027085_51940 [Spirosoma aerophilum]